MRAFIFSILFCFICISSFSQDYSELNNVEITTKEQCRSYDSKAQECANYILNNPVKDNINVLYASSFLLKWMSSTPDYNFDLGSWNTKLSNKKDYLLGVYCAGLAKFCMENKDKATDNNAVKLGAYTLLAEYCSKEGNIENPTKEMKKFLEAYKNNSLKEYLKL